MVSAVKTPNDEQIVAINHFGGKILSAGAGSGKTYVIIEHLIMCLNNLKDKTDAEEWANVLPFELPKIVLMTFTKKAAGEMSIRMMKKVDDLCSEFKKEKSGIFWGIVRQYLSMMNITTISSFCHQLLSQGKINDIDSDIQILSNVEFKNKISNLFNLWFISQNTKVSQVFQANSTALINAMIEIYSSPELRSLWREPLVKTTAESEMQLYLDKLNIDLGLHTIFSGPLNLAADVKEQEKGWFVFLKSFELLINQFGPFNAKNFKQYCAWSSSVGTLPREVKAMSEEQKVILKAVKSFVKVLRDIEEDFTSFIDHYDLYWSWVEVYKGIYNFIDHNYFLEKGYSFADLEFYTYIGLKDPATREAINKSFNYFIVDEFQDTSYVQYEILKYLSEGNTKKLFCVGDKKQAIYGFRGGELQVFNQCSEMLGEENNILLKNNFRSMGKIIHFNNRFFDMIFPLGHGFEGLDNNTVSMEAQNAPINKINKGEVERFRIGIRDIQNEKKIDLDFYEAHGLYEIIQKLLSRDEIESVCVLYRKLKPSYQLLDILSANKVSFSAQVKIQYDEDPIINLFLRAVELKLNQHNLEKLGSTHFILKRLLEVLQVETSIEDIERRFLSDLNLLGLRLAFHKMVYSLGISNSQYQDNSKLLDSICRICNEDLVKVFHLLSSEGQENYSLQLMNGGKDKRVIIMSAHASKGLEFDAILLGGIHTNGTQMGKTDIVGKLPKSFRWKKAYNQKKFYKSPNYYLEAEVEKLKEFSESKRLLYVACTRAIKYLAWIDLWADIEGKEKDLSTGSNHWIKALRMLPHEEELIQENSIELSTNLEKRGHDIPLILKDSLGIISIDKKPKLGVFAETSVTKLAHLAQCPFKFYLSNICKLSPPSKSAKKIFSFNDEEVSEIEDVFYSSMERGTNIHATLSRLLLGDEAIENVDEDEREKLSWVLKEAQLVGVEKEIVSEKQIKFSFFGQMISGTPDLVFEDKDNLIVWDFKTGQRDEKNEEAYWFQLMCYAHAYANLKHFTPEKMVPLSLLYLDEQKIVTNTFSVAQISEILFEKWLKTESLDQVNLNHCKSCDYSPICLHYKSSAH